VCREKKNTYKVEHTVINNFKVWRSTNILEQLNKLRLHSRRNQKQTKLKQCLPATIWCTSFVLLFVFQQYTD